MKITDCQHLFSATLSTTRITAPEGTHSNKTAASVLEMARAYESDGITFFLSGDAINALACFYYGFGWLHFGLSSGLIAAIATPVCPFLEPIEILQSVNSAKLEEKTYRYARLLETALASVKCAPDPATSSYGFAQRILTIAQVYAGRGNYYLKSGAQENALASYSYGHGWLDAGVTAGFFRIEAWTQIQVIKAFILCSIICKDTMHNKKCIV
jgi:hypothetical protein